MQNKMQRKSLLAVMLPAFAVFVEAAHADVTSGPYVGLGIGASRFDVESISSPKTASDRSDGAQKLYAGYRFNENWGAELGYANLGHLNNTYAAGNFKGRAEAVYLAGTGRLPLNEKFALTAKLMLTHGRTKAEGASRNVSEFSDLRGSSTSLTLGSVGAEYAFNPQTVASIELDNLGSVAKKSDAAMLSVNLKYHF